MSSDVSSDTQFGAAVGVLKYYEVLIQVVAALGGVDGRTKRKQSGLSHNPWRIGDYVRIHVLLDTFRFGYAVYMGGSNWENWVGRAATERLGPYGHNEVSIFGAGAVRRPSSLRSTVDLKGPPAIEDYEDS